jgi:hypothetical protein
MELIGSRIESARVSIRVSTSRLLPARGTTGADPRVAPELDVCRLLP